MQKSPLQIARQAYQPKMPVALQGAVRLVEGEKTHSVADHGWCLSLVGFGANGIIKGSIAAAIQSYYGLITAGSWFAKLTSLAMLA